MTKQDTKYVSSLNKKNNFTLDTSDFPVLAQGGAGMQLVSIPPGSLLAPHWHPNSNETTYCLDGEGVVGLMIPDPTSSEPFGACFQPNTFRKGDVVFLPQGYLHYFENSGSDDLIILLTFDNPSFDVLSFADGLQQLPPIIEEAATKAAASNEAGKPVIPYEPTNN